MAARLSQKFFRQPPTTLAQELLGKSVVRLIEGQRVAGIIVETEAYLGPEDRAAHTFGGRKTQRVESMWKQAGTLYVYFTYGMHHCMNVVAGPDHSGCAVLIRALEPTHGLPIIQANRPGFSKPKDLCSGPAKVCQAMAINRKHDGVDLTTSELIWLENSPVKQSARLADFKITTGPRVGIDSAEDWKDKPLRYALSGHPCVSKPAL